ncbi:glycosyltransferase family 2 protein [Candidatus Saccharibacteria bacterium]|nr:MAG: glycosyltransferase family 2 protein [Candidatus Saccharibacteria bacterium]
MSGPGKDYLTVFVPVYNGEKYLRSCIDAVLEQELPEGFELELLIIDSGSTDTSVEIVRSYGEKLTFLQIPNSEFGHGKTRQYAATIAKGTFVVYLTQDATPADRYWLRHMVEPFFVTPSVGCVFGRQIPRPFAVPIIKREIIGVFGQFGEADQIVLQRRGSLAPGKFENNGNGFFSDVNSAIRKDLNAKIPFRDLKYAEDQALAEDMLSQGYLKAYAPQGAVLHSNEYTVSEYKKRMFDEYCGLYASVGYDASPSRRALVYGWIKPTLHDIGFTLRDRQYTPYVKLKYSLLSVGYNIAKLQGMHLARKYRGDIDSHTKLSLEQSRKVK